MSEQAIIDKYVERIKAQMRAACVNDDPPPTDEEIQEGAEFIVGNMLEGMGRDNPFALCQQCDQPRVPDTNLCQHHTDEGYAQEQADLDNDDRAIGMQP